MFDRNGTMKYDEFTYFSEFILFLDIRVFHIFTYLAKLAKL